MSRRVLVARSASAIAIARVASASARRWRVAVRILITAM
jgi:hypothetical protein